ncbi:hypothetical protein M8C21_012024 [Ambrosia artemisiifolia]|uniref:Uncharacterized protein n=1 Tax=Ambrosia artemisiifolia TaxID=4212 RepID=A0AAD5CIR2_AMBAR|nr:hypothetical protein M8C21_012024 [Ambrosia artemisiifolia]
MMKLSMVWKVQITLGLTKEFLIHMTMHGVEAIRNFSTVYHYLLCYMLKTRSKTRE